MEPIDYLRALRARWRLVVLCGLIGLVAAWVTTPAAPAAPSASITAYTAVHTLVVETTGSEAQPLDLPRVALLVKTGDVPKRVVQRLGLAEEPVLVASRVSATADTQTRSIAVSVTDPDGKRAADLADAFAEETMAYLAEREKARFDHQVEATSKEIAAAQARYAALNARLPTVPEDRKPIATAERDAVLSYLSSLYQRSERLVAAGPSPSGLVSLERATPVPVSQGGFQPPASRTGRILIAGPLGLLLGAGMVLLLKRVDPRIADKDEAEESFGLPVVAEVPLLPWHLRRRRYDVAASSDEVSPVAEAYRLLRTSARLMPLVTAAPPGEAPVDTIVGGPRKAQPRDVRRQVLLVTSAVPAEGKTTTVANLAASFAKPGDSVLVIDFDVRRPEVHRYLGIGRPVPSSVPDLPIRPAELDALAVRSTIPGVRFVQGWMGAAGDRELLDGGRSVIAAAREVADVVILDTPPLLSTNHASELVPLVDAVVVVCRCKRTSAEAATRAAELLARLRATVLGVVLVGAPLPGTGRRYYGQLYVENLKQVGKTYQRGAVEAATHWLYALLLGKGTSTNRPRHQRDRGVDPPSPVLRSVPRSSDDDGASSAPRRRAAGGDEAGR